MAFKMKGSPMQRNFGVGSPAKQAKPDQEGEKKVMNKRAKDVEYHRKNAPKNVTTQKQADQLNKMDADNVAAYNNSNDSIQNVHNKYNLDVDKQNAVIDSTNNANNAAYEKYMNTKTNKPSTTKRPKKKPAAKMKSALKQTKFPNSNASKNVKADRDYAKGQKERLSMDNAEHKASNDMAYENLQNDHNVNDDGKPQSGAKNYYAKIKLLEAAEKSPAPKMKSPVKHRMTTTKTKKGYPKTQKGGRVISGKTTTDLAHVHPPNEKKGSSIRIPSQKTFVISDGVKKNAS